MQGTMLSVPDLGFQLQNNSPCLSATEIYGKPCSSSIEQYPVPGKHSQICTVKMTFDFTTCGITGANDTLSHNRAVYFTFFGI